MTWPFALAHNLATASALYVSWLLGQTFETVWLDDRAWTPGCGRVADLAEQRRLQQRERMLRQRQERVV